MPQPAEPDTFARYAITDQSVCALCGQVCGGIRRQVADLGALLHEGPR